MRSFRVLPVALLLLTMTGDGREAPPPVFPTFSNGVCVVPPPAPLPGVANAVQFWYRLKGDERTALTEPAGRRLRRVYRRVLVRARELGFRLDPPRLRQTKPELVLLLGPGIKLMFGVYYQNPRIIVINSWWVERMEDWEVEYVVAHEVGHAIDLQNERTGHWALDEFQGSDGDDFVADMLSVLLTDPESFERFEQKHQDLKK